MSLADGKASLHPLRSVQFSSVQFSSVQFRHGMHDTIPGAVHARHGRRHQAARPVPFVTVPLVTMPLAAVPLVTMPCQASPPSSAAGQYQMITSLPPFFLNGAKDGVDMCLDPNACSARGNTHLESSLTKHQPPFYAWLIPRPWCACAVALPRIQDVRERGRFAALARHHPGAVCRSSIRGLGHVLPCALYGFAGPASVP